MAMIAFAASAIAFGLCCALIGVVYAVVLAGEDNPGNRRLKAMEERLQYFNRHDGL